MSSRGPHPLFTPNQQQSPLRQSVVHRPEAHRNNVSLSPLDQHHTPIHDNLFNASNQAAEKRTRIPGDERRPPVRATIPDPSETDEDQISCPASQGNGQSPPEQKVKRTAPGAGPRPHFVLENGRHETPTRNPNTHDSGFGALKATAGSSDVDEEEDAAASKVSLAFHVDEPNDNANDADSSDDDQVASGVTSMNEETIDLFAQTVRSVFDENVVDVARQQLSRKGGANKKQPLTSSWGPSGSGSNGSREATPEVSFFGGSVPSLFDAHPGSSDLPLTPTRGSALLMKRREIQNIFGHLMGDFSNRSHSPILVVDIKPQTIIFANEAAQKLFGRVDLVGESLNVIVPSRLQSSHTAYVDRYRARYLAEYTRCATVTESRIVDQARPHRVPIVRRIASIDGASLMGQQKECEGTCDLYLRTLRIPNESISVPPRLVAAEFCLVDDYIKSKELASLYEEVLQDGNDGVVVANLEGRIEWMNKTAQSLSGYSLATLLAKRATVSVLVPAEMAAQHESYVAGFRSKWQGQKLAARNKVALKPRVVPMRVVTGETRDVTVAVECIRGKLVGYLTDHTRHIPRSELQRERVAMQLPPSVAESYSREHHHREDSRRQSPASSGEGLSLLAGESDMTIYRPKSGGSVLIVRTPDALDDADEDEEDEDEVERKGLNKKSASPRCYSQATLSRLFSATHETVAAFGGDVVECSHSAFEFRLVAAFGLIGRSSASANTSCNAERKEEEEDGSGGSAATRTLIDEARANLHPTLAFAAAVRLQQWATTELNPNGSERSIPTKSQAPPPPPLSLFLGTGTLEAAIFDPSSDAASSPAAPLHASLSGSSLVAARRMEKAITTSHSKQPYNRHHHHHHHHRATHHHLVTNAPFLLEAARAYWEALGKSSLRSVLEQCFAVHPATQHLSGPRRLVVYAAASPTNDDDHKDRSRRDRRMESDVGDDASAAPLDGFARRVAAYYQHAVKKQLDREERLRQLLHK